MSSVGRLGTSGGGNVLASPGAISETDSIHTSGETVSTASGVNPINTLDGSISLTWTDLNGDGNQDIAVTDYASPGYRVQVLEDGVWTQLGPRLRVACIANYNQDAVLLVDLDPHSGPIRAGEFSDGVTARGKKGPDGPRGTRQGVNDYTLWFGSDKDMAGNYFGYDGPCPPWNDTIPHHYVFTLYALDVAKCGVSGTFRGAEVRAAIKGHVLGQASVTGVYSLNPDVRL